MISTRTALIALAALLAACEPDFTKGKKLGGVEVSADTLNLGKEAYTQYCRACHGDKGDGTGPASYGLRPPPRDFTVATFKFAAVASGQLPNDADFVRIVKGGLHGTAMLAWEVPDATLLDIVQYLKTFSPKWETDMPGTPIVAGPDPWKGKDAEAAARGAKIYHGYAQCWQCHAAYETKQQIYDDSKELKPDNPTTEFRDGLYQPELKESDYVDRHYPAAKDGSSPKLKLLPPDFLFNDVRAGSSMSDLYRTIASGVGGTAMPSWKTTPLPNGESDLWAMAYYVHSLVAEKGTPQGKALQQKLASQPAWVPPPEPPAVPAPTDTATPKQK